MRSAPQSGQAIPHVWRYRIVSAAAIVVASCQFGNIIHSQLTAGENGPQMFLKVIG